MAIAQRGSVVTITAGNGVSILNTAFPTGTVDGDLVFVSLYLESSLAIGTPAMEAAGGTWTKLENTSNTTPTPDFEHYVFWKIAASEAANFDVTWDGDSIWRDIAVIAFSGVDTTTPLDGITPTKATGTGTAVSTAGVSAGTAGSWRVMFEVDFDGRARSSYSPAELHDSENMSIGGAVDTNGDTTTNGVCTLGSGGSSWSAIMCRIRPAGGGGGGSNIKAISHSYRRRRVA